MNGAGFVRIPGQIPFPLEDHCGYGTIIEYPGEIDMPHARGDHPPQPVIMNPFILNHAGKFFFCGFVELLSLPISVQKLIEYSLL